MNDELHPDPGIACLTVVMPCYNELATIDEVVRAVLDSPAVRLFTDQENRCYKVFSAPADRFGDPQWPDLKPAKIFKLAFRDKGPAGRQPRASSFQKVGRS